MLTPLVININPETLGEICLLAKMVNDFFSVKFNFFKYLGIGIKDNICAGLGANADFFNRMKGLAKSVLLGVKSSIAANLNPEMTRERVHNRNADTVKPAGNFVGVAAKFAAGVKSG